MRIRALALVCSFSVILSTVLAGCGGGGSDGGGGGGGSEDTSDAATRQALQTTNVGLGSAVGMLKRWNLPIPVKNSTNDSRVIQAMNMIEQRLGLGAPVFDRTSIAAEDDSTITRGLIVNLGTAPSDSICGATDAGNSSPSEISRKITINLDSAACTATLDATIHEVAHAMGMFEHFQNFGNGSAIGELFWRVLRTIYLPQNPAGTPGPSVVLAP